MLSSGRVDTHAPLLEAGRLFRRVLFRHGPTSTQGGWFDTSTGKPYVEIARETVPELRFPEWRQARWVKIATFDDYPDT